MPTYEFSQFTATEKTKLGTIEEGAEANVGEVFDAAEQTKLAGIEDGAQVDQSGAEMVTALGGLSGADRLSADDVKDGATSAIPTVDQKAKIDDAVISSPGAGEEQITQIDIVTDGGKLKVT
ncbi:unnamed protein product, partial [marine sediment metagenome]